MTIYRLFEPGKLIPECRQMPMGRGRCTTEWDLPISNYSVQHRRFAFVVLPQAQQTERFRVCENPLTVRHTVRDVLIMDFPEGN